MRLLVTRPEPDAGETAAKLRAIGHDVLVQPLLSIVFAEPPADVPTPGAILITSQNGARSLARWPQIAAWRAVPVFAAGPATARAASALGFGDVRFGARDAGSLAEVVLRSLPR
ncbi:MAG: uroporphyrinogen-III synthase, partial [Bauldia sp.]|nr:uroporphyrinogen-III synthase [Bauldia sp.]